MNQKTKTKRFSLFLQRIEQSTIVQSVRGGLVNMIPVLIIGAFALVITAFPVPGYTNFIKNFAGGVIEQFFTIINKATFGVLSVYMTFSISRSYMKVKADSQAVNGGAIVSALIAFFILSGVYLPDFGSAHMGPKSMFLAIITGLGASALYHAFEKLFRRRKHVLFSSGVDREFNRMLSAFFPIVCVTAIFALINQVVITASSMDSFRSLLSAMFEWIFKKIPDGFFSGLFFVFLSSLLWFFGIHGSDTLETVRAERFLDEKERLLAGVEPGVLTKEFFDCFVLMGGCGATICLLIAILIFSRNRAHRGLGLAATFPMIFNINELMVFGLPIVLNPIMLIPFLLVPLVCYSVSYLAVSVGWVPIITSGVEWTTPIILGGYSGTGSVAGAMLQIVNVVIGVLIYFPFVRMLDKRSEESMKHNYDTFLDYFRKNEAELTTVRLTDMSNLYGDVAKSLCADFKHGAKDRLRFAYQPQYDYDGKCVGVEALLRYQHPLHGAIYPPLVIKLAEEGGFLPELEETILTHVLADREKIVAKFGTGIQLSVNITGTTVVTQRFLQFTRSLMEESGSFDGIRLCIEVTEQATLSFSEEAISVIQNLRGMGIALAIDDFSMGKTSINYLKDTLFDEIKLDGSLVKGLFTHQNCREIIQSITKLASSLELMVVAEYVETAEQRDILREIGCNCYQGYLYSPAVYLDE